MCLFVEMFNFCFSFFFLFFFFFPREDVSTIRREDNSSNYRFLGNCYVISLRGLIITK